MDHVVGWVRAVLTLVVGVTFGAWAMMSQVHLWWWPGRSRFETIESSTEKSREEAKE